MIIKMKSLLKHNWVFYLSGFLIAFVIKYFYSNSSCNDLRWILTPTAWWVRVLSGITFEYKESIGYINDQFRFIIASSCSGVEFMIITIVTLIYSFVHLARKMRMKFYWIALSVVFSYIFTIFVNGFRIVFSIYLPIYFNRFSFYNEWLTPERLHTVIGTFIYFTSLFFIYQVAGYVWKEIYDAKSKIISKYLVPMFWYFIILLGVPFLRNGYNDGLKEYAILITSVCLIAIFIFGLVTFLRNSGKIDTVRKNGHGE
ncbi:MAG: exosortase K [Oscillospiraceae bacterium]|nr:exosortase K [Oscillospiraceae bacterium]